MSDVSDPKPDVESIDPQSLDVAEQKRQELLRLFPEVRTEGGKIDFDRLKLTLGATVDVGKERYGLTWPGKAECFRTIQRPSTATLRPIRDESVNFDTTENLIIEGDNLEVLKLLQKAYLGKVKMIYIDPPYNTGNDFIYPDNYTESLQTYLEYTGQVDAEGKRFSTNTEADGRFHSKWLNMMYPRLYLARNLLRPDGVAFITIDDVEAANLRGLCNEVFGEENFVANVVWQKKYAKQNDATWFSTSHDHILVYARDKTIWKPNQLTRTKEQLKGYSNPDKDPRGPWQSVVYTCNKTRDERPNLYYAITHPITGSKVWPKETRVWGYEPEKHAIHKAENRLWWGTEGELEKPRLKVFLSEVGTGLVPDTLWLRTEVGDNQDAKRTLLELLPNGVFDTPKPVSLIRRMLELSTEPSKSDLVLDFFGGSGTTAHAVIEQNQLDGGNRRFVVVQLPEPIESKDGALKTIADITRTRVRNAAEKLGSDHQDKLPMGVSNDMGFRALSLAESNFLAWDSGTGAQPTELGQQLSLHVNHLRVGRTDEDLLFEILLKEGFSPTSRFETLKVSAQEALSLADGALIICLSRNLDLEAIRAIGDRGPQRVVCLDEGFAGNDQLKANAAQIFKAKGIVFRTV